MILRARSDNSEEGQASVCLPLMPREDNLAPAVIIPPLRLPATDATMSEVAPVIRQGEATTSFHDKKGRRQQAGHFYVAGAIHLLPLVIALLWVSPEEPPVYGIGESAQAVEIVIAGQDVAPIAPAPVPAPPPVPQTDDKPPVPDRPILPTMSEDAALPPPEQPAEEKPAPSAPVPPPPAISSAPALAMSDASWRGAVARHLAPFRRFPVDAPAALVEGDVLVRFTLLADGRLGDVAIVRSAGHPSLDREALAMLHRAAPFPPPPSGASTSFTLPIHYTRRGG